MSKPSGGPWKTIEHSWSDTSIVSREDGIICTLSILDEATEENQDELQDRMNANACLMANAPDLLAALQMAARQNGHDMLLTGDELRQCEAAIAKATGETP